MAQDTGLPDIQLDGAGLYREDMFTDRKAGTIRRLVPVTVDGHTDPARSVLYSGQTQLLTPTGVLPLGFEIEADSLEDAVAKFPAAVKEAGDRRGARIPARSLLAHRGAGCRWRPAGSGPLARGRQNQALGTTSSRKPSARLRARDATVASHRALRRRYIMPVIVARELGTPAELCVKAQGDAQRRPACSCRVHRTDR
jgi:hypothetical protein